MKDPFQPYILWLPSWYPSKFDPFLGDFIQRHAQAAALYQNITVIHFPQLGECYAAGSEKDYVSNTNLDEYIITVPFVPTGIPYIDKIRYNLNYFKKAKNFLSEHFRQFGLPKLVHVHVPMKAGLLALWIKRKYGIPYIVSEQSSHYMENVPDGYFKRSVYYKQQMKRIFSGAAASTNVSEALGKVISNLFSISKINTIHNVVDTTLFKPNLEKENVFTFIHVSSLTDQKNINGILNTFGNLALLRNDWQLMLVGPFTEKIKRLITGYGLQNFVRLTGEVSYSQVSYFMKRAHVLVMFSRHENFPCTVIEALCCGLPVISSDVAGIKEAVNCKNGILVSASDEAQLLDGLKKIQDEYGSYNVDLIATNAKQKYSYQIIGKQFSELYESIFNQSYKQ